MPFSAINTYEEEAQVRNERHTLEIQLEKAMSVYKRALVAQSDGDYEEAQALYERLFSYDVLKSRVAAKKGSDTNEDDHAEPQSHARISAKSLQLGPAIRLRAMALKNYALLFLTPALASIRNIKTALVCLQEALDLVGTDDKEQLLLPSIVQVSFALHHLHAARLGLEIMVQNDYGKSVKPLDLWRTDRRRALQSLSPRALTELTSLDYIVALVDQTASDSLVPPFLTKYLYLRELGVQIPEDEDVDKSLTISIGSKSWRSLITSVAAAMHTVCKPPKRKFGADDFMYAQRDLWEVRFVNFFLEPVGRSEHPQMKIPEVRLDLSAALQHDGPVTPTLEKIQEDYSDVHSDQQNDTEMPDLVASPAGSDSKDNEAETSIREREHPNEDELESQVPTPLSTRSVTPTSATPILMPSLGLDERFVSPNKRRRTGRSKRSALALPADFGALDAGFVTQFNAYLSMSEVSPTELQLVSPASLFLDNSQDIDPALIWALELKDLLSQWDTRESAQFLSEATSIRPETGGIMATLRSSSYSQLSRDFSGTEDDTNPAATSLAVESFIQQHNGQHVQQVRFELAKTLLQKLCNESASPSFGSVVLAYVDEIEPLLFERQQFLADRECTALFALYADAWISEPTPDLHLKTCRWSLVSLRSQSIDHAWISAFTDQELEEVSPEASVRRFEVFLEHPTVYEGTFSNNQVFTHLSEIPLPTKDNARLQISKFKAATAFEKVLTDPTDSCQNTENIKLLEAMLMPNTHAYPDGISDAEFEAIQKFLEFAQPQFKLGLWYVLLERYQDDSSISDSLRGLNHTFLESVAAFEKGDPLLTTLSVAHDVAKRLVPMLEKYPTALFDYMDDATVHKMLEAVIKILQILQLFLLYDDAINSNLIQRPATPTWPKVSTKFRENVTMWWCIFFHYWQRTIGAGNSNVEAVNDFLSIIHERLGNLGYCGMANMCLLKLHLKTIIQMDWIGSALDLCQCLNCMLGISWSLYGDVAKHHTVPVPLTNDLAATLLPIILKLILSHRYLNQTLMRQDTRLVMDEFSKAISASATCSDKHPDESLSGSDGLKSFYDYLRGDFTVEMLRDSWHGHDDGRVKLLTRNIRAIRTDDHGLSLVQGAVILHQYKLRRRQVYNASSIRIETLDQAIDLFVEDIVRNPNRIESWCGIALANSLYCEDSVVFSSEITTTREPHEYCKSALIAASRAICLMVRNRDYSAFQKELYDSLCPQVWAILGNSLLMATMPPFCGKPFETAHRDRPFLVDVENADFCRVALKPFPELKTRLALSIAVKCLGTRCDEQTDWINLLHRSFAARKLGQDPKIVLNYATATREASPQANINEVNLELVALVWRYLRNGILPEEELLPYVKPALEDLKVAETSSLIDIIADAFEIMAEKDKWLHRARYYLAKLYELDRKDCNAAEEQLMHLFTLKSPSKPLVIWRRDTDLPGQYSFTMNVYVKYMGDLMLENKDSDKMLLLVKRFRKPSADFWDHTKCFEKIYSQCCQLFRRKTGLIAAANTKLSDPIMADLAVKGAESFDVRVKLLCEENEEKTPAVRDNNEWVQALFYVAELRRANIGPATSAMADELLILVFYGILQNFVPANVLPDALLGKPPFDSSPLVSKKKSTSTETILASRTDSEIKKMPVRRKIIRKDVVNAALQFLKPFNGKLSKADLLKFPADVMPNINKQSETSKNATL